MKEAYTIADMHTHSEHSHDSVCPIGEMAREQLKRGVHTFAVTDHCDVELAPSLDIKQMVCDSVKDTESTGKACPQLQILRGIEISEMPWLPNVGQELLELGIYDVIIGSVHAVRFEGDNRPYSQLDFSQMGIEKVKRYMTAYFDDMLEMIQNWDFDILAHLTCPARYINGKYHMGLDLRAYRDQIQQILKEIIQKGIALEINTSCKHSSYDAFMPEDWITSLYKELGGYLVTLGSDAHVSGRAAYCFDEAIQMLRDLGFQQVYAVKNRQFVACKI